MFIFVPDSRLGAPAIFVLLVALLRQHTQTEQSSRGCINDLFQTAALLHHQVNKQFQSTEIPEHILRNTFTKHLKITVSIGPRTNNTPWVLA